MGGSVAAAAAGIVKIRVLEVLATLKRAGAERTAVTLAAGLDRARFECEVVSLYDAFPGGFESELASRRSGRASSGQASGIRSQGVCEARPRDVRLSPRGRTYPLLCASICVAGQPRPYRAHGP